VISLPENFFGSSLVRYSHETIFSSLSLLQEKRTGACMLANMLDGFSCDQVFAFFPFLLLAKGFDPSVMGGFALTFMFGSFVGKTVCGRMAGVGGHTGFLCLPEF